MRLSGGHEQFTSSGMVMYLSLFSFLLAGLATLLSGIRFLRIRRHINSGEAVFSVLPDVLVVISVVMIIVLAICLSLPRLFEIGAVGNW